MRVFQPIQIIMALDPYQKFRAIIIPVVLAGILLWLAVAAYLLYDQVFRRWIANYKIQKELDQQVDSNGDPVYGGL